MRGMGDGMLGTSARTPSPALCHGGLGAWPPALGGSKGTLSLIVDSCFISKHLSPVGALCWAGFLVPGHIKSVPWTTAPPTADKPLMDGLRFGSSPPHQVLFLSFFLSQSQGEESAKALPLARLRHLHHYVIFNVITQACATMIGLSDWNAVSRVLPPLCTLR